MKRSSYVEYIGSPAWKPPSSPQFLWQLILLLFHLHFPCPTGGLDITDWLSRQMPAPTLKDSTICHLAKAVMKEQHNIWTFLERHASHSSPQSKIDWPWPGASPGRRYPLGQGCLSVPGWTQSPHGPRSLRNERYLPYCKSLRRVRIISGKTDSVYLGRKGTKRFNSHLEKKTFNFVPYARAI